MTCKEAKEFTNRVFDQIKNSRTIDSLNNTLDILGIPEKYRMNSSVYPEIKFKLDKGDIDFLITEGIIDKDSLELKKNSTQKFNDPLTKLLYSIAWKNGDLKKIKHVIKGIIDVNKDFSEQDKALVFYQFGKYLTKKSNQPIIDQHVIRAFAVYKSTDDNEVEKLLKLKLLNKTHRIIIQEYISWLQSDELSNEIKSESGYTYYIDKILFATGKRIRFNKLD